MQISQPNQKLSPDAASDTQARVAPQLGFGDVEQCCFEHGQYPDSYLVTEPAYNHFWDSERTGCIGYVRDGRYLHCVGGVIAPADRKQAVLEQFTEFVDENRYLASFFSINTDDLPLFRQCGYQATKFGENSILPLDGHSWTGKSYSWIRRQVSYATRQGLVIREIDVNELDASARAELFDQLQRINREHLSERVLKHEIGLLEGKLHPEHFFRRRLFVAHHADQPDRWEAFVACTPMLNGQGWATEMYRSREDTVRGVIPFLIAGIIDRLQAEQLDTVSLCMVPAVNCSEPHEGDSRLGRFMFSLWEKRLNFLFNSRGLYHFKSRFRPNFEPVFLCVRPKVTLGSTFSFIKSVGVFELDILNWIKHHLPFGKKPPTETSDTN